MKKVVYKREIQAIAVKNTNGENVTVRDKFLQEEALFFTDENKDVQVAEAVKYAYNGKYEIVDDGHPELAPSREETLEKDVAELKEAMDLLLSGVTE